MGQNVNDSQKLQFGYMMMKLYKKFMKINFNRVMKIVSKSTKERIPRKYFKSVHFRGESLKTHFTWLLKKYSRFKKSHLKQANHKVIRFQKWALLWRIMMKITSWEKTFSPTNVMISKRKAWNLPIAMRNIETSSLSRKWSLRIIWLKLLAIIRPNIISKKLYRSHENSKRILVWTSRSKK